jgi:hypothetical protein
VPTDYAETDSLVLSTDFVSNKISSQQLTAITAALQSGAISLETYFYNLEQGEMFPDAWTIEDEKRAIEETPPGMKPPAPAPPQAAPRA